MKLVPPGLAPDPGGARAPTVSAGTQQWRKALEDAQWQERQRLAPHPASPARAELSAGAPPTGRPVMGTATLTPGAGQEGGGMDAMAPSASGRNDALAAAIARGLGLAPAPAGASGTPVVAAAAVSAGAKPVAILGALPNPLPSTPVEGLAALGTADPTAPQAMLRPDRSVALPEWPDVVVHAHAQGSTISIGLRDRSLRGDDAVDLFFRLRAQLAAAGLELTTLTVNGATVDAATIAALPRPTPSIPS